MSNDMTPDAILDGMIEEARAPHSRAMLFNCGKFLKLLEDLKRLREVVGKFPQASAEEVLCILTQSDQTLSNLKK